MTVQQGATQRVSQRSPIASEFEKITLLLTALNYLGKQSPGVLMDFFQIILQHDTFHSSTHGQEQKKSVYYWPFSALLSACSKTAPTCILKLVRFKQEAAHNCTIARVNDVM